MNEFLRKMFRRENLLVAVLVIAAVLGIMGIPQNIGITADQLILALLGVLALDTLLERIGYLERIEGYIAKIENKLEPKTSIDNIFHPRTEFPPFTSWLQQNDEIWLAGISLDTIIGLHGRQIEQAAQAGKRFRLLIANPDNPYLWDAIATGSFTYPSASSLQQLARDALERADRMSKNVPKDAIETKVTDYDFTNSYLIADGRKPNGKMIVEMYSYKISAGERLHLILSRTTDPTVFAFHLQQFESMWENARPWVQPRVKNKENN